MFSFRFTSFLLSVALVAQIFSLPSLAAPMSPDLEPDVRPGELLVKFRNIEKVQKVLVDATADLSELIAAFELNPNVEYIEPNGIVRLAAFPNDPHFIRQSRFDAINIRQAWSKELLVRENEGITSRSVLAVLDTGVDTDHPDLSIWTNPREVPGDGIDNDGNGYIDDVHGWDFLDDDNDANPVFTSGYSEEAINHGTIVSGLAAATGHNNQGIAGVSWHTDIMPLRVLDGQGVGDEHSVTEAIEYAVANGADVINMSFVGTTNFNQSFFNAIRRAHDRGVLIVVAAGNTEPSLNGQNLNLTRTYPICYDDPNGTNLVIGVGSVGSDLKKSAFSNYGDCIDIVAPGEQHFSTEVYEPSRPEFTHYYGGLWSGTSVAAPLISGTAALIKAMRPNITLAQVRDDILGTAVSVDSFNPEFSGQLGRGILDVTRAVEAAVGQRAPAPVSSGPTQAFVVAGLGQGVFPQIKITHADGQDYKSFHAYSPNFRGTINVATGDVNGDGRVEVIAGAGAGGGPHVRVFSVEGVLLHEFFSHQSDARNGVNVAAGDFDNDGDDEIITAGGRGDIPYVRIYEKDGTLLSEFLAYAEGFRGGVHIASGDVNNDGRDEIIVGAGSGGGPHVRVFDMAGRLVSQFFAYNQNFSGGINIAVGNVVASNTTEIIVSVESNSLPTVRVFDYRGFQVSEFIAFEPQSLNGVFLGTGDVDGDGLAEILAGAGQGSLPELKIFNWRGEQRQQFLMHSSNFRGGVRPAALRN